MTDDEELERIAGVLPAAVQTVMAFRGALLRGKTLPTMPAEERVEAMLERTAAPGTFAWWRSLSDEQLQWLIDVTPSLVPIVAGKDVVHVPLVPKSAVPEFSAGQHTGRAYAFGVQVAVVRFFPELGDWCVERIGDLAPPAAGLGLAD